MLNQNSIQLFPNMNDLRKKIIVILGCFDNDYNRMINILMNFIDDMILSAAFISYTYQANKVKRGSNN